MTPVARNWGIAAALFAGLCAYNTGLNNIYNWGSTLFDSTIFATIMWHNDATLNLAPAIGGQSYFRTHLSPLLLVPNLFSYLFPGDRLTYYILVYSLGYAALVWEAFKLLGPLFTSRFRWLAAIAAFAFFTSRSVFGPAWELRIEGISPLFALLMLYAWQQRRYYAATLWLLISASLREDLGAIYAFPLAFLAAAQYWELRVTQPILANERRRWGIRLVTLSIACTIVMLIIQKTCFPGFDLLQALYYDPEHPFAHITGELLSNRLGVIYRNEAGLWLPLIVLAAAAAYWRNLALLAGALYFIPYGIALFLSKQEMAATFDSYKSFPLALSTLWPALLVIAQPQLRRRYMWVQVLVLVVGVAGMGPWAIHKAASRWTPGVYANNAAYYRDFGNRLDGLLPKDGSIRASRSIIALYPYSFDLWFKSGIDNISDEDISKITFLIWFEGDHDQATTTKILKTVHFTQFMDFPGTKIHIAKR